MLNGCIKAGKDDAGKNAPERNHVGSVIACATIAYNSTVFILDATIKAIALNDSETKNISAIIHKKPITPIAIPAPKTNPKHKASMPYNNDYTAPASSCPDKIASLFIGATKNDFIVPNCLSTIIENPLPKIEPNAVAIIITLAIMKSR